MIDSSMSEPHGVLENNQHGVKRLKGIITSRTEAREYTCGPSEALSDDANRSWVLLQGSKAV